MTQCMVARLPDRHTELARALGRRTWQTLSSYVHGADGASRSAGVAPE